MTQFWENELHATNCGVNLSLRARFAMSLMDRHANVAADDGGEDSAGRQKLRLQKVAELVERSCEMADLMIGSMEERGWIREPTLTMKESHYLKGEIEMCRPEYKLTNDEGWKGELAKLAERVKTIRDRTKVPA